MRRTKSSDGVFFCPKPFFFCRNVDESKRSFCGTLETPFFYSFTHRDGVKKEEEEEDFLKKNREEKKIKRTPAKK